jgi:hypothetical protein
MSLLRRLLVIIGLCLSLSACTERKISEDEVPQEVLKLFKLTYPKALHPIFTVESNFGQKEYEVEFELNGKKRKVEYDFDGLTVTAEED